MEVDSAEMEKYLANPSIRTSVGLDWGYLTVRTRVEPARCRYLRIPATPDPWLVLTTGGGPRKTEVRVSNGWSSAVSGPGNLALTSPGKSVEIRWDEGDGSGIETIHVCIDAALIQRFAAENFECDPAQIEIADGFAQQDPLISSILKCLGDELRSPDRSGRLFVDAAAQMLTAQLLRRYCSFPPPALRGRVHMTARKLRLVKDYIDAGLGTKLTLDDIAASVHMSSYHFAHIFKATTGQTPHAYVMRLRIERARQILRTSAQPISTVARRVGFASRSHFAATFLRFTGTTPHQFRKATRTKSADEI